MNVTRLGAMRRGPRVESRRTARNASVLSVLLLDDDRERRSARAHDLERAGIGRVREAGDPMQALDVLRSEAIDAVVTTGFLPFARFLRSSPISREAHIPMVMVSGHGRIADIAAAREAGIDDILVSPLEVPDLVHHIVKAVFEQRPFVKTETYSGPDRRAAQDAAGGLGAEPATTPLLSQAEIKALLGR